MIITRRRLLIIGLVSAVFLINAAFVPVVAAFYNVTASVVTRMAVSAGIAATDIRVAQTIKSIGQVLKDRILYNKNAQSGVSAVIAGTFLFQEACAVMPFSICRNSDNSYKSQTSQNIAAGDILTCVNYSIGSGDEKSFCGVGSPQSIFYSAVIQGFLAEGAVSGDYIVSSTDSYSYNDNGTQVTNFYVNYICNYTEDNPNPNCPYGSSLGKTFTSRAEGIPTASSYPCSIISNNSCAGADSGNPQFFPPGEFFDQLLDDDKVKQVPDSLIADSINSLWEDAATRPGYSGLPYSYSRPVTALDVASAGSEVGGVRVGDVTFPVSTSSSGSGSGSGSSTGGTSTGATLESVTPSTNTDSTVSQPSETAQEVDFGPDPGIGAPTLESPTAAMILAPLKSLLPQMQVTVLGRQVACPTFTIPMMGDNHVMDSQCVIFENIAPTIQAIMSLVWLTLSVMIFLRA